MLEVPTQVDLRQPFFRLLDGQDKIIVKWDAQQVCIGAADENVKQRNEPLNSYKKHP